MRRILVVVFLFSAFALNAQINFTNLSWSEAQNKAKEENKEIFVDVYRSKPFDKVRDEVYKTIFTKKEIADYINEHFVSVKIDMSTEEGMKFAPKLYSLMYPCLVFYAAGGDQLESTNAYILKEGKVNLLELAKVSVEKAKVKAQNSREILFSKIKYEEALKLAAKQNKMVFIDAYTSWCRPCAKMAMDVFKLNKVADFYNANFINLKIDFYKERPDLSDAFQVGGFPAFLFINGEGKLVHKAGGYSEADKFISYGKEALKKFNGIRFQHKAWNEVKAQAEKEGKMIFVDCYTSWCGPCKMLAKDVFTQKAVGDYFNANFVSVKFDMEKEGKSLKEEFGVKAYPTLIFFDSKGKAVHKIVGGVSADKLIAEAKLAVEGKGLISFSERFDAGERGSEFLRDYLEILSAAYQKDKISEAASVYFASQKKKELLSKANWEMMNKYLTDYQSREFKYLCAKQSKFAELYGKDAVANKINAVWQTAAGSFIAEKDGKKNLDTKEYAKFLKLLKRKNKENYSAIAFYANVGNAMALGDWKEYVRLINTAFENKVVELSDLLVYNWVLRVEQSCENIELRKDAAKWAKVFIEKGSPFADAFKALVKELEK